MNAVPAELRELRQWVCWRTETRNGKPTKVPHCAYAPLNRAAVDRPRSWSTFDVALERAHLFDGIGFVFTRDDPYCGCDLDDLGDDDAWMVMAALGSYTERSPSGRGAHVFVRATLPGGRGRKRGGIELYDRRRFFTVTGQQMAGNPGTIEPRQAEVDEILSRVFATNTKTVTPPPPPQPVEIDDQQLLERACAARNGGRFRALWEGDWGGYPSQSEADAALVRLLAFWTGEPARTDQLFRRSGLYREKWDQRRGELTYGQSTLELAFATVTDFYDPQRRW